MKLFGSLERLVNIVYRKSGFDVTVQPSTASANTTFQLPAAEGGTKALVTTDASQTLTGKSMDGDDNTFTDIAISSLKTVLGDADKVILRDGSGAVVSAKIVNANVDANAAIAESKLALDYSTSSLNTAISGKVSKSGDTMSGNLAMGGNKVTGLGAPSANGDALRYDQLGAANGIATLDGSGKVPVSQLPNAIMEYQGTWNASTNSPSLADGVGNQDSAIGNVYRVSVAGSQNLGSGSISFEVGDYAILNSSKVWEKADTTDAVSSVFGRTGAVSAQSGDYTASQVTNVPAGNIAATTVQAAINELDSEKFNSSDFGTSFNTAFGSKTTSDLTEGSNLYYTDGRARAALSVTDTASVDMSYNSGTGAFSAAVLPAGVDHDALQNFVANEHIDHSSVQIATSSTSGLNGGGDITTTRNIVAAPERATAGTVAAADEILFADVSASNALRKTTVADIVALASGSSAQSFTWTDGSATKSCSHSFATRNVLVEIYDENYQTVLIDSVIRTDANTVDLTRSEASVGGAWTVVIRN